MKKDYRGGANVNRQPISDTTDYDVSKLSDVHSSVTVCMRLHHWIVKTKISLKPIQPETVKCIAYSLENASGMWGLLFPAEVYLNVITTDGSHLTSLRKLFRPSDSDFYNPDYVIMW